MSAYASSIHCDAPESKVDGEARNIAAADFWTREQQTAGTGITDPLTKDSPFVPRHIGVGATDDSGGTHTYALVLGADPGPAMSGGSCSPG